MKKINKILQFERKTLWKLSKNKYLKFYVVYVICIEKHTFKQYLVTNF